MPHVLEREPRARLDVVGDGEDRGMLEARAREHGLDGSVRFLGRVPRGEVLGHLARAAAQVLPSIWVENAAQSCYDCMIAGVPLIASRIGALPEIVRDGETGLLFEPRDSNDLAEKIVSIVTDEAFRTRLSHNAREEVARYDRDRHLDEVEEVYRGVLAAHGSRHDASSDAFVLLGPDTIAPLHRMALRIDELGNHAEEMKEYILLLEERARELEDNCRQLDQRARDLIKTATPSVLRSLARRLLAALRRRP
jgi:hypothetical protein